MHSYYTFQTAAFVLLSCGLSSVAASNHAQAALAGPGYPSPSSLSKSKLLEGAIQDFNKIISFSERIQLNNTAWAVGVFSTKEDEPLYEQYFTPDYNVSVKKVDRDSVFRIASVSKVFSVWTFLMEVGDEHFSDPITKYVPELIREDDGTRGSEVVYDDIDHVRWDEVTLGQLASHLAGIPRDPSQTDLSATLPAEQATAFGLPAIQEASIPDCGIPGLLRECTREETLDQVLRQHPIFPTAHSPAYSNIAYTLLGYAQEAITGVPVRDAIIKNILEALDMKHSSFDTPPATGGVIPGGDEAAVGWDWNFGPIAPAAALYLSTGDMMKAGRAVLTSSTMGKTRTRRWLKPMSQTGVLSSAVGAPWEIRYLYLGERVSQIYTKQGDAGGYRAALVLSPEHDLGAVVFAAGTMDAPSMGVREDLMNAVGEVFLPLAEKHARIEAAENFAGTYEDKETNSTVTVEVEDDGPPGLFVSSLISRGAEVIGPNSPFVALYNAGQQARLYPSGLKSVSVKDGEGKGTYDSRLGFKATFFNKTEEGMLQDPGLMMWTALGAPAYGYETLDDWVFEMGENGEAKGVDVRMLRVKMVKCE